MQALQHKDYFLGADELVVLADAARANVIVAKWMRGAFHVHCYNISHGGPCAVVFLTGDAGVPGRGGLRSHFERLFPSSEVSGAVAQSSSVCARSKPASSDVASAQDGSSAHSSAQPASGSSDVSAVKSVQKETMKYEAIRLKQDTIKWQQHALSLIHI